jgi:hypothetical protein
VTADEVQNSKFERCSTSNLVGGRSQQHIIWVLGEAKIHPVVLTAK